MEDRDMTYGELICLFDRLMLLGILKDDDVVMQFNQAPDVNFACPFLYVMRRERVSDMIRQNAPNVSDEVIAQFVANNSVTSVSDQIKSRHADGMDKNIGLLDFKDETKPENEKFGGYLTAAGLLHHRLQQQGLVGMIDGPDEKDTAVFAFKVFNCKWIPVIAKLPEDGDGVLKIRIPNDVQEKLSVYAQKLSMGEFMISSLSSMDQDVVEFLEIARNPHLYDSQNSLSGSQSVQ